VKVLVVTKIVNLRPNMTASSVKMRMIVQLKSNVMADRQYVRNQDTNRTTLPSAIKILRYVYFFLLKSRAAFFTSFYIFVF
jgi:hypothetical protein